MAMAFLMAKQGCSLSQSVGPRAESSVEAVQPVGNQRTSHSANEDANDDERGGVRDIVQEDSGTQEDPKIQENKGRSVSHWPASCE